MVLNGEMPLPSYTYAHWDANLSEDQKMAMADWFEQLREEIKMEAEEDSTE